MITKEQITQLKHNGNGDIAHLIENQKDVGSITFVLENLGKLPKKFNGSFFIDLLVI